MAQLCLNTLSFSFLLSLIFLLGANILARFSLAKSICHYWSWQVFTALAWPHLSIYSSKFKSCLSLDEREKIESDVISTFLIFTEIKNGFKGYSSNSFAYGLQYPIPLWASLTHFTICFLNFLLQERGLEMPTFEFFNYFSIFCNC